MKHSDFQKQIIRWLERRYAPEFRYWNNLGGIGTRKGTADLHCLIRGTFVAIEVKTPGYPTLTKEQQKELEAVRLAGGRAGVVRGIDDLEDLVAGIEPVQLNFVTP